MGAWIFRVSSKKLCSLESRRFDLFERHAGWDGRNQNTQVTFSRSCNDKVVLSSCLVLILPCNHAWNIKLWFVYTQRAASTAVELWIFKASSSISFSPMLFKVCACLCVRHNCLFSFIGQAPRTSTFITVLAFCYKLTRAQIHRLDRRTSRDLKRPETKGPAREKCSFLKTIEAFFKLFTRLPLLLFHLYLPKY